MNAAPVSSDAIDALIRRVILPALLDRFLAEHAARSVVRLNQVSSAPTVTTNVTQ